MVRRSQISLHAPLNEGQCSYPRLLEFEGETARPMRECGSPFHLHWRYQLLPRRLHRHHCVYSSLEQHGKQTDCVAANTTTMATSNDQLAEIGSDLYLLSSGIVSLKRTPECEYLRCVLLTSVTKCLLSQCYPTCSFISTHRARFDLYV